MTKYTTAPPMSAQEHMKSAWPHLGEEEKQEFIAFLFSEDLGDLLMDWGCLFGDWYRRSEKEGA
jgi:hypothetical protein